ncbi:MAG: hypothetical protein JJE55_08025 [Flavobacteriaceae bacterium]|nr:hypothetical protein [Flavobacteriaceae bacterium]
MKPLISHLFILFFSSFLFAQQGKIDSLRAEFKLASNDTTKLNLLKKIAEEAFYIDSKIYINVADSLLTLAKKTNNGKYIADGHNARGRFFHQAGDDEKSKQEYLKALRQYQKNNDQSGIAKAYGNIATLYVDNNSMDSLRHFLNKAIVINKKNGFDTNLFFNYYNLGIAESNQNNSEDAIASILNALKYAEKTKNKRYIAYCNSMIGILYMEQEMYNEAEKYLLKAENDFAEIEDAWGLAQQYVNLGKLHNERDKDYLTAINLYRKAVFNYNKIGDSINSLVAIGNIGRNFIQIEKLDSARFYINKSLYLSERLDNPDELVRSLTNLGEIEFKENNYQKAKQHINRSISIAKEHSFMEDYGEALLLLSEINASEADYKDAYNNIMAYKTITDSIKSAKTKEMIVDISTKYQTEKKEKENLALKQQNAVQELAVQRATNLNLTYGIFAAAAILGLIGIFYYSKNRRRKLRDEHIINIARAKQKEHEKIGADLHSTKAKDLEQIADNLALKGDLETSNKVREIKDKIRLLSHELFQIPFSQEEFDDQIIDLLFQYNSTSLSIKHEGIKSIDWPKVDNSIKRNLYLIVSEAVSNIKNHSQATAAKFEFERRNKTISVTITDNGIGFTEDDLKKGHGIGNMRMRINEINGTIKFDALKNKGSKIGIFITAF